MVPWLLLDSFPLSVAVRLALALLDPEACGRLTCTNQQPTDPSFCISLTSDDQRVLELMKKGIRTYGFPSSLPRLLWLLDPANRAWCHLTPLAARGKLHEWVRKAHPSSPFEKILKDVLTPLKQLNYLNQQDINQICSAEEQGIEGLINILLKRLQEYA
jgi:hypothetical protein